MYIHVYGYRVQVHFYPITLDTIEISVLMNLCRLLCWSEHMEDGIVVVFLCSSSIDSINIPCRLL